MNWEQKLEALNALAECSLKMRKPGDWYVGHSVEVKVGAILEGRYGNGETPQDAVEDSWRKLTELNPGEYLVTRAYSGSRKAVRWNGYMWESVDEKRVA